MVAEKGVAVHFGLADGADLGLAAQLVTFYSQIRICQALRAVPCYQRRPQASKLLRYPVIFAEAVNFGHRRIILSADTASEVWQLLSKKRR